MSGLIAEWGTHRCLDAGAILAQHPSIANFYSVVIDLAYEEFSQRVERGEQVDPREFASRFPDIASSLLRLIRIDDKVRNCLAEPEWPNVGDEWLGFRLEEALGKGAFSRVFLAREIDLGDRAVVVKATRLGPAEARTLGLLDHPHVVGIHSVRHDSERGLTAVCLPFRSRTTLFDVAQQPSSPSQLRVPDHVRMFEQLAQALAYTHGRGVLHLDVKPSNILVMDGGHAVLMDFNLSSARGQAASFVGGTVPYMAPEQLLAVVQGTPQTFDARTDLFSLAATFYQVLTGRLPFGPAPQRLPTRDEAQWILDQQRRGPEPVSALNPEVSSGLSVLLAKCLAFSPADRTASAEELLAELARLTSSRPQVARRSGIRKRLVLPASAAIILAIVAAVWQLTMQSPSLPGEWRAAQQAYARQDYREALNHVRNVLREQPGHVEAQMLRDRIWIKRQEFPDQSTLAAMDAQAHALYAHVLSAEFDMWPAAALEYSEAIKRGLETPAVLNNRGYCLYQTGDVAEAEVHFRRALAIRRDFAPANHNLARVKLRHAMRSSPGGPLPEVIEAVLRQCPNSADLQFDGAIAWAYRSLRVALPAERTRSRARSLAACEAALLLGLPSERLAPLETLLPDLKADPEFRNMVRAALRGDHRPSNPLLADLMLAPTFEVAASDGSH